MVRGHTVRAVALLRGPVCNGSGARPFNGIVRHRSENIITWEIGVMLSVIVVAVVLVGGLIAIVIYSVRLQRRAVVTQNAVVDDHFSEKAQRQRHLALSEGSVEIQRRAVARDEEALQLLRRSVQLNEEILTELRKSKN
jgi:uncharacterized membrane protein